MAEESEEIEEQSEIDVFDESEESEETEDKGETETEEPETPEGETETEETESASPAPQQVPIAALLAEREKRQGAEQKLENYEDIPDPVEDKEGFANYLRAEANATQLQERINLSRSIMVDVDPDYGKYEAEFMAAVGKVETDADGKAIMENGQPKVTITNQDLYNQFAGAANPAKFARDMGKDILSYRERMDPNFEENLRKKWEAEQSEVPDITGATAADDNSEPEETPAGLDSVFENAPL